MSPFSELTKQIDEFEKWKDSVAEGNTQNLENMTFLEFMAKLDRIIEKAEREDKQAKERINEIKHRHG